MNLLTGVVGFSFETNTVAFRKEGYTRNVIGGWGGMETAVFCDSEMTVTLLISWHNRLVLLIPPGTMSIPSSHTILFHHKIKW